MRRRPDPRRRSCKAGIMAFGTPGSPDDIGPPAVFSDRYDDFDLNRGVQRRSSSSKWWRTAVFTCPNRFETIDCCWSAVNVRQEDGETSEARRLTRAHDRKQFRGREKMVPKNFTRQPVHGKCTVRPQVFHEYATSFHCATAGKPVGSRGQNRFRRASYSSACAVWRVLPPLNTDATEFRCS